MHFRNCTDDALIECAGKQILQEIPATELGKMFCGILQHRIEIWFILTMQMLVVNVVPHLASCIGSWLIASLVSSQKYQRYYFFPPFSISPAINFHF